MNSTRSNPPYSSEDYYSVVTTTNPSHEHTHEKNSVHTIVTNIRSSYKQLQNYEGKFGRKYLAVTYTSFFVFLCVLGAMEVSYQVLCHNVTQISPLSLLTFAAGRLEGNVARLTAAMERKPVNGTELVDALRAAQKAAIGFNEVSATIASQAKHIFYLESIYCGVSLIFMLATLLGIWRYRHLKVIKSRGRQFLIYFYASGAALLGTLPLLMYLYYGLFFTSPDATSPANAKALYAYLTKMQNAGFSAIVIGYYLFSSFVCSFIFRQRVIYLIFGGTVKRNTSAKFFVLFPIMFLITAIGCVPVTWWRFVDRMNNNHVPIAFSGKYIILFGYLAISTYYTYKTRHAHLKFSDFHSNIRMTAAYLIFTLALHVSMSLHPLSTFAFATGWSSYARLTVNLSVLELVSTMVTQSKFEEQMPELTRRSVSVGVVPVGEVECVRPMDGVT